MLVLVHPCRLAPCYVLGWSKFFFFLQYVRALAVFRPILYAKVLTKYDSTRLDQIIFVWRRSKNPRGLKIQVDSR